MYSINSLIRVEAGRQGETGLRKVVIDCTAWTEAYPDLTITVVAIRPGETEPYVPTGVTLSDGILMWIPDAVDTAIAGTGLLGIQGTDASEHVIKSAKTTYVVESAVDTPQGYVPAEPEQSWLAHAEAVLQDMLEQLAASSAGTITDWLEENITQETGYVIDTSLTVQNAAADAKAVGDTIGALLETVTYTMTASGDWRKGYYQRADGAYVSRNYYMCTTELIDLGGVTHVSVQPPEGYNASLTLYDAAGALQSVVGYVDSQSYPAQAGVAQESDARGYAQMGIGIGRFVNNDAATYAADPTFTGTIEITVTRLRQVEVVTDVQVNGSSVVSGGVANVPIAGENTPGVVKIGTGLAVNSSGVLYVRTPTDANIKAGTSAQHSITPEKQHAAAFYGLAKAAGDATQSASSNAVGTYTDEARKAIKKMLGIYDEWELIAEVTTEEDLDDVVISTDISGQPFELKRALIRVQYPAISDTTGLTSRYVSTILQIKTAGGGTGSTSCPTLSYQNGYAATFMEFLTEIICNIPYTIGRAGTSGNNAQNVQQSSGSDIASSVYGVRLKQYSTSAPVIPAGTTITIYGIRI